MTRPLFPDIVAGPTAEDHCGGSFSVLEDNECTSQLALGVSRETFRRDASCGMVSLRESSKVVVGERPFMAIPGETSFRGDRSTPGRLVSTNMPLVIWCH